MQDKSLKQSVIKGFLWKAVENGGDQLITFVISIVLARLLGPEKYGTMSVMLIFVTIANVIIQTGFQTALIQKKEVSEDDFSSVFWLGLLISLILYGIIFIISPVAASYFDDPEITPMLRALSIVLFFGSVTSVLFAKVARELNFRLQCIATVIADILSGVAGIIAAVKGAGTWALIIQQLLKNMILMLLLIVLLSWRPSFTFRMERIKSLFSYGWKVLVSGLIDTIYNNLYTPVIKKLYDPEMVGFYNRANQFPQVIANSAAATMQAVLLPAFSKTQGSGNTEQANSRAIMRRTLKTGSYVMFPAMFGIMAVSESLVRVLLGDAWMGAVTLLRLCCLSYSVWHIHVANLQAINANGRSDIYLKLEILKKIIGVLVLILSAKGGVTLMILMKALFDYVCTFINGWPNRKIIGYSPLRQWRDIMPEFLSAGAMGIIAYLVRPLMLLAGVSGENFGSALLIMAVQIIIGISVYIIVSLAFRLESMRYLKETVLNLLKKR
ncbi:MAG: lipopolysaccharide biosynthesis protein [Lachnospiraceae bacterium]|nr:lipopolysaccharide biosynthesis protein [Lachnospiraceae bacterium]